MPPEAGSGSLMGTRFTRSANSNARATRVMAFAAICAAGSGWTALFRTAPPPPEANPTRHRSTRERQKHVAPDVGLEIDGQIVASERARLLRAISAPATTSRWPLEPSTARRASRRESTPGIRRASGRFQLPTTRSIWPWRQGSNQRDRVEHHQEVADALEAQQQDALRRHRRRQAWIEAVSRKRSAREGRHRRARRAIARDGKESGGAETSADLSPVDHDPELPVVSAAHDISRRPGRALDTDLGRRIRSLRAR